MKRAILAGVTAAAMIAAAGGGFIGVRGHLHSTDTANVALVSPAAAQAGNEPIYYQDPDGHPLYSLTPKKTPDGRDYRAVPASADLSFEDEPAAAPAPAVAGGPQDKILPQSDGAGRYLADAEEGSDGDGLHPGLRGR